MHLVWRKYWWQNCQKFFVYNLIARSCNLTNACMRRNQLLLHKSYYLSFFLIIRNLKSTWLYILFTYFHLFIYMCFYSFIIGCCCLCLRLTWLSSNLASLSCLDYTKCLFGSGRCLFKNLSMLRRSFQCWSSTLAIDHNK